VVQAADNGWGKAECGLMGVSTLDLSRIQGEHRRVQAWLYDSLNHGLLAQRLQTLVVLKVLLDDWYFPWALLRQESQLTDMLTNLVMVCSPVFLLPRDHQPGHICFRVGGYHILPRFYVSVRCGLPQPISTRVPRRDTAI
jgi:hypothetical protein